MSGTSQQCLCTMMTSSDIAALNYFSNNTCQLFSNASITNAPYSWTPNINALFYFLYLPTKATAVSQDTTTSALSTVYKLTTVAGSTGTTYASTHLPTNTASTKTVALSTTMTTILPVTVAGTGVAGSFMSQLNQPNDVFITSNGTIYVADYSNNRIQIFGSSNTTAIASQNGMGSPKSVCVDNASNYYVIESATPNNRISKWPLNQTTLTLLNAYGIAMDSKKDFYLSTLDNTIVFWNVTSNLNTTIIPASKGLSGPRHIYLDEENQALYIADYGNHRIVTFYLSTSNITIVAGGHGPGIAANQLNNPAGVCVSKRDGAIYVADTHNHRVQKWIANGTAGVTVLGNANGTSANGIFGLYDPYAVALDTTETFLYVADSDNNRIQRIAIS